MNDYYCPIGIYIFTFSSHDISISKYCTEAKCIKYVSDKEIFYVTSYSQVYKDKKIYFTREGPYPIEII